MAKKKPKKGVSGNPAKTGWEPLMIAPASDVHEIGMAHAFHATKGQKHWYAYRSPQPATQCLAFFNRLYNGFCLVFEDGSMHLSFKRNDRAAVRDWRHFQAIKNEVAGPDREAVEIFPAEHMLVDAANEYHLWVLPEGMMSPMGLVEKQLGDAVDNMDYAAYRAGKSPGYRQRGWEEGIPTGLGLKEEDK